jgi:SAM-dependent methyltransferase
MPKPWVRIARRVLPRSLRRGIYRHTRWPPVGAVRFGSLDRLGPVTRDWGSSRGQPVDRYYIESFLERRADDIRGRVLEIKDATYTRRFGGSRVERSDVLHPVEGNPDATIVGDLTTGEGIEENAFDCVICTQTLHLVYDVAGAIASLARILAPGGVALATVPGISQISRHDMDRWGDFWRFTSKSARRLFEERFPAGSVQVDAYGNVKAAAAFLYGLASRELGDAELKHHDPDYEVLLAVRAVKRGGARG